MSEPARSPPASPIAPGVRSPLIVLAAFLAVALLVAFRYPFPSNYDELEHYSVVVAQHQHPALLADPSHYLVVDPHRLTRWSATHNYINHPALYYLLLAPLLEFGTNPLAMRLANVALTLAALVIVIVAGRRVLATRLEQGLFTLMAASFPKAAIIGGMINNDNLAGFAGALVMAGCVGMPGATWWLALGLVLAGWSKLTALIALGTVVAVFRLGQLRRDGTGLIGRATAPLTLAAVVGSVPYLVSLARTGHVLYRNDAHFFVPPGNRPSLDVAHFVLRFGADLIEKWPAAEASLPLALAALTLCVPLTLATWTAAREGSPAEIGRAYGAALLVLLAIHAGFSWAAYRALGDLTNAQPRYYNVLWPGITLAATTALARLGERSRAAMLVLVMLVILPTAVGGIVLTLL